LMTVAECFLLVIFQAILPIKNQLANRLLGVFLLSIAVTSACVLVLWNNNVGLFPLFDETLLPYFLVIAQLLKGPMLLLYVVALTQDSFSLNRRHLLHLIPIVIAVAWLLVFQISGSDLSFRVLDHQQLANAVWHFIKVMPFFYGVWAVIKVRSYLTSLQDQYSTFSSTEPSWLNTLSWGFLITWSFSIVVHVQANTIESPLISDVCGITDSYIVFILIIARFINSETHTH